MKSLLLLSVIVVVSAGVSAQSTNSTKTTHELANRFIGAWRLASLEQPGADGKIHKADCSGMFVFTADGHVSVQVMYRNAQTGSAYAQNGFESSYGSYYVDDSSTFTFHIEGALVRSLIGKDLKRAYTFSGSHLIVTSVDRNEHWRVVWERY